MLWIYVLAGTAGFVLLVPTLLRSIDGYPSDITTGALGFFGSVFGACGVVLQQFDMSGSAVFAASAALGLAAGAIHPEVLNKLRPQPAITPLSEGDANP